MSLVKSCVDWCLQFLALLVSNNSCVLEVYAGIIDSLIAIEEVKFRVVWKKNSYSVTFPLDEKVLKLKEHIQTLTGVFSEYKSV